jgi:hypothetical protein
MLKKEFKEEKELYMTPMIIIFSALPQTILTLIYFVLQVFGFVFYVLPSTTYKNEFHQTAIAKNCFKWIFK